MTSEAVLQHRRQGARWAEQARTAVAGARTATLTTRSCRAPSTRTVVSVATDADGRIAVRLEGSAPAVPALAACRVATLTLPGPGSTSVRLTGSFTMGRPDESGMRWYTPTLLSVRLVTPGGDDVVVPVESFLRTRPDAFGSQAASVLAHLAEAHGEDLLAAAREAGYDAAAVVPLLVDRDGVELAVLGAQGVDRWRAPYGRGGCPADDLRTVRLPVDCACEDRVG